MGHINNAPPGFVGHLAAFAVRCRNGRAAGQRQAQRFGHRVHGGCRAHGVAVARRRCAAAGALQKLFFINLARGQLAAAAPDDGARTHQLSVVPAIEHRPAREHDGRNVHRGRGHDASRRGLVAARGQHHRVDGVAVQDLHQPQVGQVAVQCGRGPAAVFKDGVNRELHRNAARIADAVAHAARQVQVDAVAGRQVAARLRDADDGPARAQFLGREPVVHEAFEVHRGHVRALGGGKPVAGAEGAAGCFGHGVGTSQKEGRGAAATSCAPGGESLTSRPAPSPARPSFRWWFPHQTPCRTWPARAAAWCAAWPARQQAAR
ncbi:hypothetical protein D3C71_1325250 [compost metagenome]